MKLSAANPTKSFSTIQILVATHKPYWIPADPVYMPLQVGAALHEPLGYEADNTGENISAKNPNFCELTGLYWAWKNMSCDYIGLCHYRRYFSRPVHTKNLNKLKAAIYTGSDYKRLLQQYDIILPVKRNYYIETVRSQYEHAHFKSDLDETERIIAEKYPDYSAAFTTVMNRRSLHLYNMFVMSKAQFDTYCKWLFTILFTLEQRIDISSYDTYEARVFGFLSERLFNVWLEKQQCHTVEIPVVSLEPVNWGKKIKKFLERKFLGRKQK